MEAIKLFQENDSQIPLQPNPVNQFEILERLEALSNSSNIQNKSAHGIIKVSDQIDITQVPSEEDCNLALIAFLDSEERYLKPSSSSKMLDLMERNNIQLNIAAYNKLMQNANSTRQYAYTEKLFNELVKSSLNPNIESWTAVIISKSKQRRGHEALKLIDNVLAKSRILPTIEMFEAILRDFIYRNLIDDARDLWMRLHEEVGLKLSLNSFHLMMKCCARTKEVEKAFFYFDELKSRGLTPNIETFDYLIRACAEAPHWIQGYEDIIYDALSMMEGYELQPTVDIYNIIIYAFGKAGDATAAEFYFWEMKRKGIKPIQQTYNNLLFAYGRSCSVGAESYGYRGRWVRTKEKKYTKETQALADVGPDYLAKQCMLYVFKC